MALAGRGVKSSSGTRGRSRLARVRAVTLTIDESTRQVRQSVCGCCDTAGERTWADIHADVATVAVYFVS